MQIGGSDIAFLSGYSLGESRARVVRAILDTWPKGVIEEGSDSEVFVYKNQAALDAWTDEGWTEEYCKSMINVMVSQEGTVSVTCVVEDPGDHELAKILEAVKEMLS